MAPYVSSTAQPVVSRLLSAGAEAEMDNERDPINESENAGRTSEEEVIGASHYRPLRSA